MGTWSTHVIYVARDGYQGYRAAPPGVPCTTPLVVVLVAGGLRVLKTQHVDGRAEGVPALARLGGVTAGRGGNGGAWG